MKTRLLIFLLPAVLLITGVACSQQKKLGESESQIETIILDGPVGQQSLQINLEKGRYHNHPTFALWIESLDGTYIKTLYVTRMLGTGIYGHGAINQEKWDTKPGPQQRPATLPYWLHKRSAALNVPLLPSTENPVTDATIGATPAGAFRMESGLPATLDGPFRILMEINQPWDWNEFWTNALYDDPDYRTSCQPSLVYAGMLDPAQSGETIFLNPIGHGHFAGWDGRLYTDLRSITTAKDIIDFISVKLIENQK
ncbi:MAG: hypothetical protein WC388_04125 [Bacteroidales bacterium]|jgi:hypothetical protein